VSAPLRSRVRASARPIYHRVIGPMPPDPTRGWRGNAAPGEPAMQIAYYGDCAFRAMDRSHGLDTPVGWPASLAERLRERGRGLEWSTVFMPDYEHLPTGAELTRYVRLSDDPQAVVVHTGGAYGRRVILPDIPRTMRFRNDVGRRLGRHVFTGYRVVRPVVRLAVRPVVPYNGAEALERFLVDARNTWPQAAILVLAPLRRLIARAEQRRLEVRLIVDSRMAADGAGVDFMDLSDVLRGPGGQLRCANGYNLNEAGSRLVAELLFDWLEERAPAQL